MIKRDKTYVKILDILKTQIKNNILEGQIRLGDPKQNLDIVFEDTSDLRYALHGLHKVDFQATNNTKDKYSVNFTLYDIYDFSQLPYKRSEIYGLSSVFVNNQINAAEISGIVKNFEIKIKINELIIISHEKST